MKLPQPRGPISQTIFDFIKEGVGTARQVNVRIERNDVLDDEDFHIALWSLYELHYRCFDDVDERWEWDPRLLGVRAKLEEALERDLHELVRAELASPGHGTLGHGTGTHEVKDDFSSRFFDLVAGFESPPLAAWIGKEASRDQILEYLINRSIYQLKEADPHTWVIPRLSGGPKSALLALQFDEYGDGIAGRTHAELFATTLREAGLDAAYGAYIEDVGARALAVNNVMSLFGLHRRHRGAAMGHLAAMEASSSLPSRLFATGIRRAGFSDLATEYFVEHIEADAIHEQLAVRAICAQLIEEEPALEADIMFGALCCLALDARLAKELLARWETARRPEQQLVREANA